MATETLYAASVFSGSCGTSGNALGAPDGTYTTDADNTSWTCRFNLTALSTGNLTTGTNGQSVTVRTRKETGTGTPSYVLTVYEGGSLVYFGGTTNVTSTTSQDDVFTWTSTGTDGSDIDIQLAVTASGGSPSARTTVQLDAITWTADWAAATYDFSGTVTGVAPATSGTVTGKAARAGAVTGLAPATSGTITDTTQRFGAVAGSATASGTVTGTKQEANNDFSGTVTGSATASGTVAGTKAASGAVAGSATASGTVTGSENSSTTVTGTVTATGTATGTAARAGAATGDAAATGTASGTKDTSGTADGSATATGTVTGTAYDPDAPVVVEPESTGGGKGYPAPRQQKPAPKPAPVIRKSGTAHGTARATGHVRGTKGTRSTLCATSEVRAATYGTKATSVRVLARTTVRSHVTGLRRAGTPAEQERRRRDEDDLLLLIEETP